MSLPMLKKINLFFILLIFCRPEWVSASAMEVFVSIPPQAFLVEKIGGPHVTVRTLINQSQDPHTFEPTPQQIHLLGTARLYFTIDIPFEQALTAKIPKDRGITVIKTGEAGEAQKHDHAHEARALAPGVHADDPHIWLAPRLLKRICGRIVEALKVADPGHASDYLKNHDALIREIDALDREISQMLAPFSGRSIYVYHPAFDHFTQSYGIRQVALEFEGKTPSPKRLAEMTKESIRDNVKTIFVQPQFDQRNARILAEAIGATVTEMSDLDREVLANLRDMAVKIRDALSR